MGNDVVKEVFGYIGLVFFTATLLPQIYKNYQRKSVDGVSEFFIVLFTVSTMLFGVYVIVQQLALPVILDPEFYICNSLICWSQFFYYKRKWSLLASIGQFLLSSVAFVAVQFGLVYGLRAALAHNLSVVVDVVGIIPIAITAIGYIPQYSELITGRANPHGLSLLFLTLLVAGSIAYIISLAFHDTFDWVAFASYAFLVVGSGGLMVVCAIMRRRIPDTREEVVAVGDHDEEEIILDASNPGKVEKVVF